MEKPRNVVRAVNCIWASIALGFAKSVLQVYETSSQYGPVIVSTAIIILLFTLAAVAFIIFKVSAGRNWARITYAVMFLLGMAGCVAVFVNKNIVQAPIYKIVLLIQIALQSYATFLLFTKPGSAWFQKVSADQKQADD